MLVRSMSLVFALTLGACGDPSEGRLIVDVRTDLVAGVDFEVVGLSVDGLSTDRAVDFAARGSRFLDDPFRLEESLGAGTYDLRVYLARGGETVIEARARVQVEGTTGIEVVLQRSCLSAGCGSDDNCLNGACVAVGCLSGNEPECVGFSGCVTELECPEPTTECIKRECLPGGTCVEDVVAEACGADAYCDPSTGCTPWVDPCAGACSAAEVCDEIFGCIPDDPCPPDSSGGGVSEVIGTIAEGEFLVICGSGFGDEGPNVVLYDDFEGSELGAVPRSPTHGRYWQRNVGGAQVSDVAAHSGGQALSLSQARGPHTVGLEDEERELLLFDEAFVAWSVRDVGQPPGIDSTPDAFASAPSSVEMRLQLGENGDHGVELIGHGGGSEFHTQGDVQPSEHVLRDFAQHWDFGGWNHFAAVLRFDAPATTAIRVRQSLDAQGFQWVLGGVPFVRQAGLDPGWDRLLVGDFHVVGAGTRVIDDLYVALGAFSSRHVEVCGAPLHNRCQRQAIAMPVRWSDERIVVMLHLGDLVPGVDSLTLHVLEGIATANRGFPLPPP